LKETGERDMVGEEEKEDEEEGGKGGGRVPEEEENRLIYSDVCLPAPTRINLFTLCPSDASLKTGCQPNRITGTLEI
jgi:hypothetical protein